VSRNPQRAVLLAVAAAVALPALALPASAADQQVCVWVPETYASGRPWTPEIPLCVPVP
jgi:hypothetical protein